jgi:S-adenosylmethionine:diacylglycerol 3-amino-3-carboxypropyl transferase
MNQRHLLGITECLCRNCATSGGNWRRFVKRDTRRFLRHTAAKQIRDEIASDNDHNGDVMFRTYQMTLTLDNARNLRSIDWNY